jgi:hypothetical protein
LPLVLFQQFVDGVVLKVEYGHELLDGFLHLLLCALQGREDLRTKRRAWVNGVFVDDLI